MQKKKLLFLLLFLAVLGNVMSQDNPTRVPMPPYNTAINPSVLMMPADTANGMWSTVANYPIAGLYGVFSYYWPDSAGIYCGGGSDASGILHTEFYLYKPATNTYIPKAPLPVTRALNKMVRVKNKLYVLSTVNVFATPDGGTYEYDPAANTWTTKAVMNAPLVHESGLAVYKDSLIFCVGGSTSGFGGINTVRYYNPTNNTWTTCPTVFPVAIDLTQGECIGDQIVMDGGYNGSGVQFLFRGKVIPGATMDVQWRNVGASTPTTSGGAPYRECTGIIGNTIVFGPSQTIGGTSVNNPRMYGFQLGDSTLRRYLPDEPTGAPGLGNVGNISIIAGADSVRMYIFCGYFGAAGSNLVNKFAYKSPAPIGLQSTTCRNGINVVIPDNLPAGVKDSILMPAINGCTILDVNVRIDTLLHTYDSDLTFDLTHGATTVRIINAVGTSGDNFLGTVLNDSASTPIASGVAPFTGSFQPSSPLSAFNTAATNGSWVLLLVDHAGLDSGSLKAWCVSVTYQCPTGGITTIEIPNTYKLNQNYPNPFNPTTTISYGMPKSGLVKLVVYDILGREVRTLVNEFKTEGTYNVSFDASSLASGVYFYTLKANDFTSTKKMLLVK